MAHIRWLAVACVIPLTSLMAVANDEVAPDPASKMLSEATARQFRYYDELDLELYQDLEMAFGDSSRIIASTNVVRFGNLQVRAKLVVPRSDAPIEDGFLASSDPEPVRIMLDYALVSCGNGCSIGILTDQAASLAQYKASHATTGTDSFRMRSTGFASRPRGDRAERHASMILIEGKHARKAIHQLNSSRTAHIFLVTAVHGAADFQFDTSAGAGN